MKTIQKTLVLLAVSVLGFAQSPDQAAIRKVIESENLNYHTNPDRTVYFSFWEIKPESRWAYSSPDWVEFMTGEDLKNLIAKKEYPPVDHAKITFYNFSIKEDGNVGWVTFDKKAVLPDGKSRFVHSFYCLEKIKGAWKIISASEHGYTP